MSVGPKQDGGERDGGYFLATAPTLLQLLVHRGAGLWAELPAARSGWHLPSLPCEQVLPLMIHVVSGWAAVGGHPGPELASRGVAPWGLPGLWGVLVKGSPLGWDEHWELGSGFPTCSWDCLLLHRI